MILEKSKGWSDSWNDWGGRIVESEGEIGVIGEGGEIWRSEDFFGERRREILGVFGKVEFG